MKTVFSKKNKTVGTTLGIIADKRKYKLDNAAIGFSLISNKRVTNIFRISCTLTEEVKQKKLQTALSTILPRFPYYRVSMKKGLFWGKWVTNLTIPEIQPDSQYPCQYISFGRKNLLYRIIVNNNTIALECHHCLTDGYGGLIFLNSLVAEYFRIEGEITKDWKDIFLPEDNPDSLEYENAFDRYHKKKTRLREKRLINRNFKIPKKIESPGFFHLSKVVISLESIKRKSKEFNVSITALLTAIYYESLKDLQERLYKNKTRKLKPILIRIPVNLRRMLESKTMRNFSLAVRLNLDPRKNSKTFKERIVEINSFLKNQIQPETFYHKIARNKRISNLLIMYIIPFQIKRFLARNGYFFTSGFISGGFISNLGKITIPDQLVKYIDSYEFAVGPAPLSKERVSLISFKDKLVITFSRVIKESILAEMFIRKLEEMGIEID